MQGCFDVISAKDDEELGVMNLRRRDSKKTDSMKVKAATTAVLGGLFMVLGFIFKDNMKFVDDYR